jgi:NTP pyrophosphatase (non-canonical NTP hydrolase)
MNIQKQIDLIREWGSDRNIIGRHARATMNSQFDKFLEESNELDMAIVNEDYDETTDAIGDTAVTLILLAELHGVSFEDCLEWAYNEIENRTGKMVNGQFVKDAK